MDFSLSKELIETLGDYRRFLAERLTPFLSEWYRRGEIPRSFFQDLGQAGWFAYSSENGGFIEQPSLRQALVLDELARRSPGVAVAVAVHMSLGSKGIFLFGTEKQKQVFLHPAMTGELLVCLANTEAEAGSDVAAIASRAEKVDGGWLLNGSKAYTTNGAISDHAIVTAVTDPRAERSRRLSMFLVNLSSDGVSRTKLHKEVWIPSDLTRIRFKNVFVPDGNILGERGRGLRQVLEIFTHSRLSISALTLGTAAGAFDMGLKHAKTRSVFGKKIVAYQAKAFEAADYYSRIEAAGLVLMKACWLKDTGRDFRLESSMAKYLTVDVARAVSGWAADIFGAASVVFEHPVHKFPMDAWASSLGEGTQDIQKLVIFREIMKKDGERP
jgi:alkylation response protein AidB-like acyl-CoA dehydrogenase